MSTKKDRSINKDSQFMKLAINLASDRVGLTGENPSVGCIIVKDNEILSFGQTSINGRPHAEYNAIKSCKKSLKGSTIYISLEPCSHHGKTPPCTDIIIKSKIRKVVFSTIDIDERSKSKSTNILKSKKISVKKGILKKESNKLYNQYFFNKTNKMPFVTGKLALSKDNFISSSKKLKITNIYSDKITQLLRYKNDSILISSKTLKSDNPRLNCRIDGLKNYSPKRIILDKSLTIKKNSYIFSTSNKKNTIIFYNRGSKNKIKLLKKKGIKLIKLDLDENNFFDLKLILKNLFQNGCRNLLVEGGKSLTKSFIKYKLFNTFYLFKSSRKLGKSGKLNVSNEINQLFNKYKSKIKINSFTGDDLINIYSKQNV